MRVLGAASFAVILVLSVVVTVSLSSPAQAASVTFSGTVTYQGSYSGDTLYVAVIDTTTGNDNVNILGLQAFTPGSPPFSQPYSITFDNTGLSSDVLVASFLDVNGGGLSAVDGVDIFGWYAGTPSPTGVSPSATHSGLDFDLPRAEIHGTITFEAGQTQARLNVSPGDCFSEGFRPTEWTMTPGPYAINGIYPGTYCVSADGSPTSGPSHICFGDPTCASPTLITLTATQVMTGVDLDFSASAPVERLTWGRIKALYP